MIEKDEEICIECGACFSLCPTETLFLASDYSVGVNPKMCNGVKCSLCLDACPRRALQLKK